MSQRILWWALALVALAALVVAKDPINAARYLRSQNYKYASEEADDSQQGPTPVWTEALAFGSPVASKQALEDWDFTINLMKKIWNLFGGPSKRAESPEADLRRADPGLPALQARLRRMAQETQENEQTRCLNHGFVGNISNVPVNKCIGQHCVITEMECQGQRVDAWTYAGPLGPCTVTRLFCNETGVEDLSRYTDQPCHIDRFLCGHTIKTPDQVTNVTECDVQLHCGARAFGFQAFDFICQSDKLICNGTEVADPQGRAVSSDCQIVAQPCDLGGLRTIGRNATTTKIRTACYNSIFDNVCRTRQDHTVACPAGQPGQFCRLKTIDCGLSSYDASQYNGSLALCQNVRSVECNGVVTQLNQGGLFNTKFCRVAELNCNGTIRTYIADIPKSCSISKVVCADVSNLTACATHMFGCAEPSCTYATTQSTITSNCTQPGQIVSCVCPIDFYGDRCNRHRPIDCNFTLVEPKPKCDPATEDAYYLNDPVCYEYKSSDVVQISFNAECTFRGMGKLTQEQLGKFNYSVVTDTVALSAPPDSHAVLRIFNFNRLSDYQSVSPVANFTREVLLKQAPIQLPLNMTSLIPDYAAGGRVYAELRVKHEWSYFSDVSALKHRFVFDLVDWVDPVPRRNPVDVPAVVAGVLIPTLAVAIGLIAFFFWRKRKAEREKEEEEDRLVK